MSSPYKRPPRASTTASSICRQFLFSLSSLVATTISLGLLENFIGEQLIFIELVRQLETWSNFQNRGMAFQQYLVQEWESIPKPAESEKSTSPCFDCSICLDFARDPVVTLCGHLYCWPCIYKWFDTSLASHELPQCPVCKAEISEKTMVPLYGRGKSLSESEPEGKAIPPRPSACGGQGLTNLFNPEQQLTPRDSYQNPHNMPNPYPNYNGGSSPSLHDPSGAMSHSYPVGMFGEMVYARVFGNSQSLFTYPNSYHSAMSSSPRLRRLELQAHTSLNRLSVFLFCFILLCLAVF